MVKKELIAIGIVVIAGLVVSQVYAHGTGRGTGWGMHGMMGWGRGHMMGQGYYGGHMAYGPGGYSKESRELEKRWESFYDETGELRRELRKKHLELGSLLSDKSPDEGKVLAKHKEIAQLRSQLEEKELQFRLKNRDLSGGTFGYCYGPGMGW